MAYLGFQQAYGRNRLHALATSLLESSVYGLFLFYLQVFSEVHL